MMPEKILSSSVKRFPEDRAFLRLAGCCRRHFGPFGGNPNRQPV